MENRTVITVTVTVQDESPVVRAKGRDFEPEAVTAPQPNDPPALSPPPPRPFGDDTAEA